jgi:hypothetical protein
VGTAFGGARARAKNVPKTHTSVIGGGGGGSTFHDESLSQSMHVQLADTFPLSFTPESKEIVVVEKSAENWPRPMLQPPPCTICACHEPNAGGPDHVRLSVLKGLKGLVRGKGVSGSLVVWHPVANTDRHRRVRAKRTFVTQWVGFVTRPQPGN